MHTLRFTEQMGAKSAATQCRLLGSARLGIPPKPAHLVLQARRQFLMLAWRQHE